MTKVWWKTLVVYGAMMAVTNAAPVTFLFNPGDFLNHYSTDISLNRADQDNPRVLVDTRQEGPGVPAVPVAGTYDLGLTQPAALNNYENWLAGLSEGEGIYAFNMWVTTAGYPNNPYDGNPVNPWNQEIFRDGSLGNSAAGISATAGNGWTAEVLEIYAGTYGVEWWTTDPSLFLRPGFDPGYFSFTMEDTNAQLGEDYRVWFGSASLIFDEVWGELGPDDGTFASGVDYRNARWNGVITARAVSVPDLGASVLLFSVALAGLGAVKRKLS